MQEKFGVLLMAFGGPDTPEAIEPFVRSLLGGKKLPPPAMASIKERYRLIGGSSPLVSITRRQARALQRLLGDSIPVVIGMRHAHPTIEEGIKELVDRGVTKVVAVSLSPHYSRVSSGAYRQEAERVLAGLGKQVELIFTRGWYDHPLVIEAFYRRIQEALCNFSERDRQEVELVFSAHSLPAAYIAGGEPYVDELNATVRALVDLLPGYSWHLAYQSKGGGKGEWLGPEVGSVLDKLAREGKNHVLVIPLSFAADHVETLYDIDIALKNHAKKLGIDLQRSGALNDSGKFIEALAEIIQETTQTSQECRQ